MKDLRSIPASTSDLLLRSWGYDLIREYAELVARAGFDPSYPVLELATGSGRMTGVLATMDFRVVSGDRTQNQRTRVFERAGEAQDQVTLVGLDMSQLPFRDMAVRNITCVNTLHELSDPHTALQELLRVRHLRGRLLLADFNALGLDVMQRLEQEVYRRNHPIGTMSMADVERELRKAGVTFERFETTLNVAMLVGGVA